MEVFRSHPGWIEVITGSMFSGKSEELIRRVRRAQIARQRVAVFKPMLDARYDRRQVASHDGARVEAVPVRESIDILEHLSDGVTVAAIHEAQFLAGAIVDVAQMLAARGGRVIVAGG